MSTPLSGAQMLVKAMQQAGVEQIFSLSGNHIMCVYDALIGSGIKLLHTRHEAAAVHMADTWARLKAGVGVAMVTGGPGHANAVSALYTAYMSESPVILLSGHAPLSQAGKGAFQEIDQVAMTRPVVKAAWAARSADTLAEDFAKACRIALSGRPGPVHLSLPNDVLDALSTHDTVPEAQAFQRLPRPLPLESASAVLDQLARAKQPIVILGPEGWKPGNESAVARLEASLGVPVVATESPRGVNDPALGSFSTALAEADCVLLLGKRLDFTLGFGQAPAFSTACRFLQIDADLSEFERSTNAVKERLALIAHADTLSSVDVLAAAAAKRNDLARPEWLETVRTAIQYRPPEWKHAHDDAAHGLHPAQLCAEIQAVLDRHPEAVLVVDGGEFGQWAQACLSAPKRVINGAAGAIGSALPMALAAKIACPEALVVALMGDGTFGFHSSEFDTATRAGVSFLCVVGNDACWNAEHQIQLRSYGQDRAWGCDLLPTEYDKVAAAFGGHGVSVNQMSELPAALEAAISASKPACLNVRLHGLPAPKIRLEP